MSAHTAAYLGDTGSESEDDRAPSLSDAIHTLAQPLTALSFVLEMGRLQDDASVWRQALETGSTECRRAIQALEQVRNAAQLDQLLASRRSHEEMRDTW